MSSAFPTSTSKTSPARLVASETLKLPRWALIALCLLYILPGLIGRDPWKSEDATTFGVMWTMAKSATSGGGVADWLLPNVVGAPVVETGPLMYWVGAACIRLFDGLVSADLAARLATVIFFFMAVTGIWYATYLVGRRPAAQPVTLAFGGQPDPQAYGRVLADGALLILLATIGLLIRAHESSSDVAMLAMLGVALYGMARSLDAPMRGAPWIAGGLVGLVLSRGPGPALALALMWIVLVTTSREFRGARRAGLVLVLPLTLVGCALWPLLAVVLLPDAGPHLAARVAHWRAYFDGIDAQAFNKYVRTLPWTSWIAWPLAAWCVWTWRRRLGAAHIVLPGSFVLAMTAMLATTSDTSDGQLLLVLPGLVMLAACGLPTLRRGAANAFDWFSLLLYSIAAIFVWFSYFTRMTGVPAGFARSIARLAPGASPDFRPIVFTIALAVTVAWIVVVYWRIATNPRVLWRSVVLASGGLILVWTLTATLFLYSVNYSRTYRDVAAQLSQALTAAIEGPRSRIPKATTNAVAPACVATDGVGLAQRASFAWFGSVRFSRVDYAGTNTEDCEFLLRQDLARHPRSESLPPGRWKLLWEGRRAADRDENYRLFRKTSGTGSTRGAVDAVDRDAGRGLTAPIITAPAPAEESASGRDAAAVEDALTDASTPRPSGASLARRILTQAWPVLVGQWASIGFGVADTVMVGHASPQDLAAMALGSSIYASIFVGLMGVVIGISPVIAQHFGATRDAEVGRTFVQGAWLAVWLTVVGVVVMGFPDAWLVMSQVDGRVVSLVGSYLHALMFALPAALFFRTVYALNVAVSRSKVTMAINLVGLALKVPLNYVLVYGEFGLPALGAPGCGYASAIVLWISCAIALVALSRDPFYRRFSIRFDRPRWALQKELLRIGVPTGLTYIVEVTSFTFMTLLVAGLGTQITGGHQIVANLAAFCYMLPLSLSVATSAIVAQSIGAGDALGARRVSRAGLRLAIGIATTVSIVVWFGRHAIVSVYTNNPEVAQVALSLVAFVAIFHVFDATQGLSSFVLRAYRRAVAPMLVYTVALWGFGLVGGWWIAFHPVFGRPLGVYGLWGASTFALAVAAFMLVVWMVRVTRLPLPASRGVTP